MDNLTPEQRRKNMQHIKSQNTKIEVLLRKALWKKGYRYKKNCKTNFIYSYVKCIPNFRGLVMAITDHRRIKTVNSFFNPMATYTKSIQLKIDGVSYNIPMSRGINVIIGDNSIGKSMLLHKLTGFRKQQDGLLKRQVVWVL